MSAAPLPRLAPLDERVLAALTTSRGKRAARVAAVLLGTPAYRCRDCGASVRVGQVSAAKRARWEERGSLPCHECGGREIPVLRATPEQRREVREILRGLEHIGLASCRGGWWRRA